MKHVLVLDANQRSALAVTRSLGKRGVTVYTADETHSTLAGASRFAVANSCYPSPRLNPELFISFIAELIEKYNIEILFPMTELTSTLLLENSQHLHDAIVPFANIETVNALSDKCLLMKKAETLSVPTPKTWYVNSLPLTLDLNELPYPLVLKPGKSWLFTNEVWSRNEVRFASDPDAAKQILESDSAFINHPFMFQQCVSGYGQGIFAIYDHGQAIAFFAHRRLREKPPSGGVSVLSESIEIDPMILDNARKLLDDAKWHGVAMVEFKVNEETNTPYLMEINTRFWGSLQLAINAGVDFPWLLYQLACKQPVQPLKEYKIGTRSRWILGDLDNLYLTLRDKKYSTKSKLKAILQFITPNLKTRHEVNRWNDMQPFWYELKQYVRDLIK